MSNRNVSYVLFVMAVILIATSVPIKSQFPISGLIVGRNVNMVSGILLPGGDPHLQRQNEPSMAVSTRNPMHILAAANDYRPVYSPESEGPLPGITLRASTGPDAWLGIFKSYNGGQSWTSTLLSKDPPLDEYSTACDPTVRAGPSGLFFTSGIAFNRIENGSSAIFVARYMDNNTQAEGDMDSIKELDVTIIDEGTSGQFADKPWIAVAAPNYGSETVRIDSPGAPPQYVPRFDVFIVYSIFLGSPDGEAHSKIMFARSTDCGNTWEKPIKLSESVHVCQGTNIAVSPLDGTVYVVWRQYAREEEGVPHAMVICKSDDSGKTFTKATEVAPIDPFDQFLDFDRFRTSAFPALVVDHNGVVYLAWSQRGVGPQGDARIVIKSSLDGIDWTEEEPVDDHPDGGHQIMPSLTYAGGQLMMTWYDLRKSLGYIDEDGNYLHDDYIQDPGPTGKPHTIDTWVARAAPSDPYSPPLENPVFTDSTQVSRYIFEALTDPATGELVDADGVPISISENPPVVYQAQFSYPNFPLFMGGLAPFIGDYLDIAPAPMFLYDYENGIWRFNTGEGLFDPTLCHITFACNRDVIPPVPPLNWMSYWPPGSGCLGEITAGMRNQNIYTAPITHGIMVGAPVNTKPLSPYKTSFLVFVKNLTDLDKLIRLTIDAPADMDASFWEFGPPQNQDPPQECPIERCEDRIVELPVMAHSSITLTVFVEPYEPYDATFRVDVEEIDGEGIPTGLRSSVVLNPDPVNTQFIDPIEETHTPSILLEVPEQPLDLSDPTMLCEEIVYSPYLEELLNSANPDIVAPTLRYPTLRYDSIINPTLRYPTLRYIPDAEVTDLQWTAKNDGNTTSAYSFEAIGETPSVPYQLLIHKISKTPMTTVDCLLSEEEHHELLLSIENPTLRYPTLRYPTLRYPTLRYNTFFLAPGEEAVITLRLIDPEPGSQISSSSQGFRTTSSGGPPERPFNPQFYAKTVAGAVVPQASDPDGNIAPANFMWIFATTFPDGSVNDPYPDTLLEAEGGAAPYTWSLVEGYGDLPPGLTLDDYGLISGTPAYHPPYDDYAKSYYFVVQATDSDGQIAYRSLSLKVILTTHMIQASSGAGGSLDPEGSVEVINGFDKTFNIVPDYCYEIEGVVVDEEPQVPVPTSFTFYAVREPHEISATFKKIEYNITATPGENGTISPFGNVTVLCGESQTFTIEPDLCYTVGDVLVDGQSVGAVTSYTFNDVQRDHTIAASFVQLSYTITPTAGVGGSINPADPVTVLCGENQTFTITTDEGYQLTEVLVDGDPVTGITKSAETTYTFYNVQDDHTIEARFQALFAWDARYNNDEVNGDDEANDIAVDLSGNIYVTGDSMGRTTGADFYTLSYDSDANVRLSARLDGPAQDGDFANAIAVDSDGNVYSTGYSFRGMAGSKHKDYLTAKYDSLGELKWDVRYDARRNGNDESMDIVVDNSGYVYITGRSEESLSKQSDVLHYDFYTMKFNSNSGSVVWDKRYNNEEVIGAADEAAGIAVDTAGNVFVTGRSQGNGTGFDYLTIKYDKNGNFKWAVRYDGENGADEATGIAVDETGNIYVTGTSQGNGTGVDCVTIKYDTNGNPIWDARYDGENGADEAVAIAVDGAGNAFVTGKSQRTSTGFDYVTIKYDASGSEMWAKSYDGGNGIDEAVDIATDEAGDVYITGVSQGDGTGFDYLTVKYDSSGNLIWHARYNHTVDDIAAAIAVDTARNVYVTGKSQGSGTGFDFATVKYVQYIE